MGATMAQEGLMDQQTIPTASDAVQQAQPAMPAERYEQRQQTAQNPISEAQRLLQEAADQTIKACLADIDAVLKKHNCGLDITMEITARGNRPRLRVIPQPAPQDGVQ
jgi:multidrug resistance efflux pump